MIRARWVDLSGVWQFEYDDSDVGISQRWNDDKHRFSGNITVPFPPESAASGIGKTGYHDVMWYRRELTPGEVERTGHRPGDRLLIHFGAVDYRCDVWLDGVFVGHHEGGHTPFSFEIQHLVRDGHNQVLTVRAEDLAADVAQPRGKQDWQREPHVVWYHRTSGIWQPVWLEATPDLAIEQVHWTPDIPSASVVVEVRLNRPAEPGTICRIELQVRDTPFGQLEFAMGGQRAKQVIPLSALTNGQDYEDLLWTPETPVLIDGTVELLGDSPDGVSGYFGIRSVATSAGHFLLNDRPYFIRSVLSQGYWPESHLASPSPAALRKEVELIRALGFNSARVHQKIEDPRFLFWADRLGLALWGEAPAAYEFSDVAVERTTREWLAMLDRDRSHPSIVTWVPLNESWGIQQIAHDPTQLSFARALVSLTKAVDGSRPVISNDGWEHAESDILSIHDYEGNPDVVERRYGGSTEITNMITGIGPAGRRLVLADDVQKGTPVMLTEFGGIEFAVVELDRATWSYSQATTARDFETALGSLYVALSRSPVLAGTCYTQLTDTLQEANGLVAANRIPKLEIEVIRSIVRGTWAQTELVSAAQ